MTVFPFLLTITPFLRKSALMTPKYISLQLSSCEGHIHAVVSLEMMHLVVYVDIQRMPLARHLSMKNIRKYVYMCNHKHKT